MNAAIWREWNSALATGIGRGFSIAFGKWPITIGALLLAVSPAFAVDTITTRSAIAGNPSGVWSNTAIWSAGQVPTNIGATTWHVIVPNGVPITQVDGDYTINRLDVSGAIIESLDAGHLLTVVNELNVNGGIFRGPGTTLTQGQTTWASNAQINNNHILQNSGPFSVVDFLIIQSGGLFENLAAGVVTLQSDGGARAIGGANRNAGTYNLSITSPFGSVSVGEMETTASGVVNVLSGSVSLTNLRQQAGTFNIASTAAVSLSNNNPATISVFTAASSVNAPAGSSVTLSGLSRLRIEGVFNAAGSVTAQAQEVEWTSIPQNVGQTFTVSSFSVARFSGGMPAMNNLSVAGGTLTGGGDQLITGTLTGSGTGVLAGNGTSTLASGNSASGNLTIDQRKLVISAGATSTLSATLINNGELQNLGTVTNADFLRTSSSTGTFRNDAAYNVTSNLHRVDAIFAGSGITTIANGATLAIERDGGGAQQFIINGSLNFGTTSPFAPVGTRTFDAGSSFTGSGNVNFARGITTIAGSFAPGGPVTVEGGTANFNSAVQTISMLGTRSFSGGTFNFNAGLAQVGTLQLGASGFLNITGNTTVTGTADFLGDTHGGSGITAVQGTARLGGMTFNGRQVDFQNSVVPASGGFNLTNNATIRVAPGAGRLNLDGFNVNVNGFGATPGQLVNAGVIDNTHPTFPDDEFLFRVDVPFVQEATGRIDNGHDLRFSRNVNAAGGIVLTRPESRLLLQAAGPGIVQTFTGPVSGPGSILIEGPAVPPANVMRVNFDGGLELSADTSELRIKNADVTVTLSAENAIAPETVSGASGDGRIFGPVNNPTLGLRYFGSVDSALRVRSEVPSDARIEVDTVEIEGQGVYARIGENGILLEATGRVSLGKTGAATNLTLEKVTFQISTVNPVTQIGAVKFTLLDSSLNIGSNWTITDDTTIEAAPGSLSHSVTIEPLSIGLPRISLEVAADIAFAVSEDVGELGIKQADLKIDGTVDANLRAEAGATISGARSPGDGIVNGNLTLIDTGTLLTELAGTQQGVSYDFLDLNGTLTINGGLLELTFLDGFQLQVQPSDVFTVLDADSSIIGSFANVASGGQLLTSDGLGFFNVYYGAGSPYGSDLLVVTNFMVPEPSAAALIILGGALSVGRRRRC